MKREIMGSIFIGFVTLAVINLYINSENKIMGTIMTGISIYSFVMTLGQFLYRFADVIKSTEFQFLSKSVQSFYRTGLFIGKSLIQISIAMTILSTYLLFSFFENYMVKISNSATLLALGVIFLYIGFYED